jgi:hypothetical protein
VDDKDKEESEHFKPFFNANYMRARVDADVVAMNSVDDVLPYI